MTATPAVQAAWADQTARAARIRHDPLPLAGLRYVAGADTSSRRGLHILHAAITVVRLPDLALVEVVTLTQPATWPYIPGLLSYREAPVLLAAFAQLQHQPDALVVDGHGLCHPRRFGLACHLGLALDLPAIGCAKRPFGATYAELGPAPGDRAPLLLDDAPVGLALRTRRGSAPVFVSVGHRAALDDAAALVLACAGGYRLPAPTRLAHVEANAQRRAWAAEQAALGDAAVRPAPLAWPIDPGDDRWPNPTC